MGNPQNNDISRVEISDQLTSLWWSEISTRERSYYVWAIPKMMTSLGLRFQTNHSDHHSDNHPDHHPDQHSVCLFLCFFLCFCLFVCFLFVCLFFVCLFVCLFVQLTAATMVAGIPALLGSNRCNTSTAGWGRHCGAFW